MVLDRQVLAESCMYILDELVKSRLSEDIIGWCWDKNRFVYRDKNEEREREREYNIVVIERPKVSNAAISYFKLFVICFARKKLIWHWFTGHHNLLSEGCLLKQVLYFRLVSKKMQEFFTVFTGSLLKFRIKRMLYQKPVYIQLFTFSSNTCMHKFS